MDERMKLLAPVIPFEDFVIRRASGNYLYTEDDRKILDVNSGQFCAVLGHSNPDLAEIIGKNATTHQHSCTSAVSEKVLFAAHRLNEVSGSFDARTLLLSTGSEAVETCLRYAKHVTGKDGVICFHNGYHGLTMGSQSITYSGVYARPLVPHIFPVRTPHGGNADEAEASLRELEEILDNHAHEIGVAVIEPVVSVGGLIYPGQAFLAEMSALLRRYGVLLALDESQTGFGRLGRWFAFQKYSLSPDFVICSKAIGLGYPVAALLFSGRLVDESAITLTHYSSHQNDSFAADIVSFGIEYIERHNLMAQVEEKSRYFLKRLKEVEAECDWLVDARGVGFMLGMDFEIPSVDDYRPIYREFHSFMLENGVLIQGSDGGRVLRFLPSYTLSFEEIDQCIEVLKRAHEQLRSHVYGF
ncbi:aspartate aminotransferase family protein [Adlercreutzia sp. ZJ138]|uniref:class-III pyridoxal-phosphate-dependent aminotransferase n=1 Tax=Adlercreutzia sp. ZJ138 TaxID=2709405 RepID=UPI0013ED7107|nr:aspartate aminotransferase family protein [Adlercreutzia sp. ZJ138]